MGYRAVGRHFLVLLSGIILVVATAPTGAQTPGIYVVDPKSSDGFINLRRGPNTSYPVIAEIRAGSGGVTISECGARENPSHKPWCKAQWNGNSGWVSSCCIVPATAQGSIEEIGPRSIQRSLMWLGHYPGPIDGEIGAGTISAIKKFQADNSGPATGELTAAERTALNTASRNIEAAFSYKLRLDDRTHARIGLPTIWIKTEKAFGRGTDYNAQDGSFEVLTRNYYVGPANSLRQAQVGIWFTNLVFALSGTVVCISWRC